MRFNLENINGFSVLSIMEERIDAHNSADLKTYLLRIIEAGEKKLIVQLQHVRFIDSSGLGALLSGNKHILAKSGKLVLTNIQPQVLSMFELTRLNRVFDIYTDINEAFADES